MLVNIMPSPIVKKTKSKKRPQQHSQLKHLPKKVKIGHQVYAIEADPSKKVDTEESFGMCQRGKFKKIILDVSHDNKSNLTDTLLHEILHAIWWESGLYGFKKVTEEQVVTILASWLTIIFSHDKGIRNYFTKYWK